ncbi:T-cell surface glycoprotein CD3 delta chain [Poecilia reticulata]|uniref:T-cell surface glycoprotein CD3 delta chain n=1 Tax=Poecilia reticulata TaxID=8081 RepID=A0A3P9NLI2_POERE|nr:PREDICTED: T-cell surface glycoprotein CD3 delta chain [Poecilia reticulata]
MKYQLLLLSLLAAFSNTVAQEKEIQVIEVADGIKLSCKNGESISGNGLEDKELQLTYSDHYTGEYSCEKGPKIFVKFRTCDNCVELDTASIVGLAVGDVVATIVVGVAVYLIASQGRPGQVKATKKRSDKHNLILNEAPNDPSYQPLKYKRGRDEYDVLNRK